MCNKRFTLKHTLSGPYGGFPSIRHNEIRNITAHLMSEVCHNVGIEPTLQPLSGETMSYQTANSTDGASLDVKAQGFWGCETQCAIFDVRVFNPLAHSYHNTSLANSYRKNEQEKHRAYDQSQRSRAWLFLPPCLLSGCRNATICHSCLQETSHYDLHQVQPAIQPNHQLAQMPTNFLSPPVGNYVHPRISLLSRTPSTPNPE